MAEEPRTGRTARPGGAHAAPEAARPTAPEQRGAPPLEHRDQRAADQERLDQERVEHERVEHREHVVHEGRDGDEEARDRFGGVNLGAAFFGWIVAVGLTVLLSAIVGAVATGVGYGSDVTRTEAERSAGTIGIVAAAVAVAVLALAYYGGGYVAGRMSRFDGAKQGLAVWVIGLVLTLVAAAVGAWLGSDYDLVQRAGLDQVPLPTDQLTWGAVITGVAALVITALAAMAGGAVGRRYHAKVDRVRLGR